MRSFLFNTVVVSTFISILSGCANMNQNIEKIPCWIDQPMSETRIGQIGIARDLYAGGDTPITKSRKRAFSSLANFLNPDLDTTSVLELINEQEDTIQFAERAVYFGQEATVNGYVHSYASLNEGESSKLCESRKVCDLSSCSPSWLCNPSENNGAGVLGVSYRASSLVEQHDKSIQNALFQAAYLYGVDISAQQSYSQRSSNNYRYATLNEASELKFEDTKNIAFAVTDRCVSNGTLFSRVELFNKSINKDIEYIPATKWLGNPKYSGHDGAIGSVQKPVASGLISDQIKLAIKRAAVQLAFEQESAITEEQINIESDNGRSVFISFIHQETLVKLQAKVIGFHFQKGLGNELEVYVWLARSE